MAYPIPGPGGGIAGVSTFTSPGNSITTNQSFGFVEAEVNTVVFPTFTELDAVEVLAIHAENTAINAASTANTAQSTANTAQSTANTALNVANYNTTELTNLKDYLRSKLFIAFYIDPVTNYQINFPSVPKPSSRIPSENEPIAGGVYNGWRFTKPIGVNTTKINWFIYNPLFPTTASYPPGTTPPSPVIYKKDLKSVWFKVYTANPITTQGVIYMNIYTLDCINGSTSFYTNRWSYSLSTAGSPVYTPGSVGLVSGYTYILYAWDAPKLLPNGTTAITQASGQNVYQSLPLLSDPVQTDLDIPHIAFGGVIYNTTPTPQPLAPNNLPVTGISIETTSSSVTTALDITVLEGGYITTDGSFTYNFNYTV